MKSSLTMATLAFVLTSLSAIALCQHNCSTQDHGVPRDDPKVEVTKSDFTRLKAVRATQLLTFGVVLGQQIDVSRAAVQKAGLTWQLPTDPSAVITVGNSSGTTLFGINTDEGVVVRVVWYQELGPYLAGESGRVVDFHILDQDSPLRLRLVGREDNRDERHFGESGRIVTYSYDKEGLRFIGIYPAADSSDPVKLLVHLVPPAKSR